MYLFTFTLLGFFAFDNIFLQQKRNYIIYAFICVFWLIFHDGFRWGIGTDWDNYYYFFQNCLSYEGSEFEIGYVVFNQIVRSFTDNYSVFIVLHATIVYLLITKSILKYSPSPFFSIFFFYCMMLVYLGMNRQYIALALCIFSYKFIFERKFFYFALCMVLAFLFHRSSILFFFAYFLNRKFSMKFVLILFLSTFLFSISGIMNKLPLELFFLFGKNIGDKLSLYSKLDYTSQTNILFTILAIIKRSTWLLLALIFYKGIKNKDQYYNFFFNLYFLSTIIYLIFNNTILQVIVARGIVYLNIAEIFIIPYVISIFKDNLSKKIVFLLILIYGFLLMEKGMNYYKDSIGKDIFRPYNSVLINDKYKP